MSEGKVSERAKRAAAEAHAIIAHAVIADLLGERERGEPGAEEAAEEAGAVVQAAIDAETESLREALRDVLAWIDEVGAEAKRRDTERLAPARALLGGDR